MLKGINKPTLYGVLGFAAGYYVGRNYDLKIVLNKVVK